MVGPGEAGFDDAAFDYAMVQAVPCVYCGQDVASVPPADLPAALVEAGRRWRAFGDAVMDYPGGVDALRARPQPDVWAAVEYACYVRDVLSLFARYVELALLADRPQLEPWDHEAAVSDDHYREHHPSAVADDIEAATRELAGLLQPRTPEALARTGVLARPDKAGTAKLSEIEFTNSGLARYALHETVHHLGDAAAVVPAATT